MTARYYLEAGLENVEYVVFVKGDVCIVKVVVFDGVVGHEFELGGINANLSEGHGDAAVFEKLLGCINSHVGTFVRV